MCVCVCVCVCSGGGGGGGGGYSPMKMTGFEEQTAKSRTGLLFFFSQSAREFSFQENRFCACADKLESWNASEKLFAER